MICRKALLFFSVMFLSLPEGTLAQESKVFVLHSYHAGYAWTEDQQQGFFQAFNESDAAGHVSYRVESLDGKTRQLDPAYLEQVYSYLKSKYAGFSPSLVYATDDDAIAFLARYGKRLFPHAPVIYSGLGDFNLEARLDHGTFFGIFDLADVAGTIALALRLEPGLQTLLFVGDASASSRASRAYIEKEAGKFFPQIKTVFFDSADLEELKGYLAGQHAKLWVVNSLGAVRDANGSRVAVAEVLRQLGRAGDFKILAMKDIYLTPEVLGGAVNRGREQGVQAGYLARERLLNDTIGETDTMLGSASNLYLFDYAQMLRFGLTEADLPPGSTIVNRPRSFWLRNRSMIVMVGGFGFLQLVMACWLLRKAGARRLLQKDQRRREAQFQTLVDATHDAVVVIDERGLVTLFNPAAEELFGWSAEEMLGQRVDLLMPEGYRKQHRQDVASYFKTGEPAEAVGRSLEMLAVHRSGREFPIELSLSVGQCGRQRYVLATLRDISGQRQVEREIKQLAYYDSLTGLPNRALFEDRFRRVLNTAERTGRMAGLLFIGVDNLKAINDTRGHACGDRLLKLVGQRLVQSVKDGTTVVRWEGDKFIVLLPGLQEVEETDRVAGEILQAFGETWEVDDQHFFVTASIGGALYPLHGTDGDKLLKHADMAMYAAKEQGRNIYCTFTEEMNRRILERTELEHSLRKALAREEFFLAFQPQIDQSTGRVVGCEALIRWRHAEKGMISPAQFIPLAEESGLILPIGHWVLRMACVQNRAWQQAGYPPMRIAVNLSARQFQQPDFYEQVAQVLRDTGLDPHFLELELTESLLMADADAAVETLGALRDLGVGIAIDDFGTGYSSLSYLKTFPIDRIKIAQDFMLDIARDPGNAAIVETIIAMAHGLGLDIVAEGVETGAQLEFLQARQCHVMQGFYFGHPMPAENFIEYLSENHPGAHLGACGSTRPAG